MSTIGKIFLVLNLILAGAFVGWAANSLGKNKELVQAHAAKITELNAAKAAVDKEIEGVRAQLNTERTAKDQTRAERDQFEADAKRNKEELEAMRRANDQLRADVSKINETMGGLNNQLQSIEAAKDRAVSESHEAQKQRDDAKRASDAADTARRTAEENLGKAQMDIADLERQLGGTKNELAALTTRYDALLQETGGLRGNKEPLPQLNCQVVKADYSLKPGLVALNIGSSKGVKSGFTFEIYAGNVYKGQVRVETVHADMCSALITFAKDGTTIAAGDSASTRL